MTAYGGLFSCSNRTVPTLVGSEILPLILGNLFCFGSSVILESLFISHSNSL